MRERPEAQTLAQILRVVRARWYVIIGMLVLGGVLAFAHAKHKPDQYTAEARVSFDTQEVTDVALGLTRDSSDPERIAATAQLTAESSGVRDRVVAKTGIKDASDHVTVAPEDNANVMTFSAQDTDPAAAAKLANTYANEFVGFRRDSDRKRLADAEQTLQEEIAATTNDPTRRDALASKSADIASARATADGNAQVIGLATVPTSPSSPKPKRDAVVGALVGLILALAIAFALDLLDRRIRTVEEFEQRYRTRALATIPQSAFGARSTEQRKVAFEPYRMLRNAVGVVERSSGVKTILVTGAVAGEGKTSVAVGLARALALSGQRVVLVECDLRRPSLTRHLDLVDTGGLGLTNALVGRSPVREQLISVQPALKDFSVLPSGPLPPNAGELLRSAQMGTIIADLASDGAVVILDAPPLLPVADTHALLAQTAVDAVLMVGRVSKTTREEAVRARATLERLGREPFGMVVCGVHDREIGDYYYGPEDGRRS